MDGDLLEVRDIVKEKVEKQNEKVLDKLEKKYKESQRRGIIIATLCPLMLANLEGPTDSLGVRDCLLMYSTLALICELCNEIFLPSKSATIFKNLFDCLGISSLQHDVASIIPIRSRSTSQWLIPCDIYKNWVENLSGRGISEPLQRVISFAIQRGKLDDFEKHLKHLSQVIDNNNVCYKLLGIYYAIYRTTKNADDVKKMPYPGLSGPFDESTKNETNHELFNNDDVYLQANVLDTSMKLFTVKYSKSLEIYVAQNLMSCCSALLCFLALIPDISNYAIHIATRLCSPFMNADIENVSKLLKLLYSINLDLNMLKQIQLDTNQVFKNDINAFKLKFIHMERYLLNRMGKTIKSQDLIRNYKPLGTDWDYIFETLHKMIEKLTTKMYISAFASKQKNTPIKRGSDIDIAINLYIDFRNDSR